MTFIVRASRCWPRLQSAQSLAAEVAVSEADAAGAVAAVSRAAAPVPSRPAFLEPPIAKLVSFDDLAPLPESRVAPAHKAEALAAIQEEIGDCTRCPLAYAGRRTIVFGDGDANARLMFVGEGPGADEDTSGVPFVGKAGQLLNNMIQAMGLKREAGLHRQYREVQAAGESRSGAGGGEYLRSVSAAADRCGAAAGGRGAGCYGGDVSAGGEAVAERRCGAGGIAAAGRSWR